MTISNLLRYEPTTGELWWVISKGNKRKGDKAGTRTKLGYNHVRINGKAYKSSRVAWLLTYGQWPVLEIDHINGITHDDRLENLREVSRSINRQNQHRASKNNTSGYLGVYKRGVKYRAMIWVNGKHMILGTYDTPEEAHTSYVEAKRIHHEGCTL